MATPGWVHRALGRMLASYLKLVQRTNRLRVDPPDLYDRLDRDAPFICALWHGQHFMIPLGKRPQDRYAVLISRHGDGAINAAACENLEYARSGASGGKPKKCTSAVAFRVCAKWCVRSTRATA